MEAIAQQLPTNELQSQPEQAAPGLASRIGSTLRNGYEAFMDRVDILKDQATTLAAIGGIAFVGAQAAELALNATPAGAEATTPAAGTTSTSLKQECVKAGLKMPKIVQAVMHGPGTIYQEYWLEESYGSMPADCTGKFRRISEVQPQFQDAHNHHKWHNQNPPYWQFAYTSNQANIARQDLRPAGGQKRGLYQCTPGPAKTDARFVMRNEVKSLTKGHPVVGHKTKAFPVKIYSGAC